MQDRQIFVKIPAFNSARGSQFSVLMLWLLALSACMPTTLNTPNPNVRVPATLPPPVSVESSAPISDENAPGIALLGRFDQPSTPSTVFAYSISPDSTLLAGLNNDELLVWNLIDGSTVSHTARIGGTRVFFAPDKTSLYTVTPQGAITTFDAETTRSRSTVQGHGDYNNIAAFDANNGLLALAGNNGEIKVWDVLERTAKATINASRLAISALAFSADGSRLASAASDGSVIVWDWANRAAVATVTLKANDPPTQIAVAPDGSQFAVTTSNTLFSYALADGKPLYQMAMGTGGAAFVFTYSPDSRYIANGGETNELTLWDAQTGKVFAKLPGATGDKLAASFSPDGTLLVTTAMGTPVRLWDLTRVTTSGVNSAALPAPNARIIASRWTDDSRLILLFEATGSIEVWGIGATQATATPTS